jgi:hypothetical protein
MIQIFAYLQVSSSYCSSLLDFLAFFVVATLEDVVFAEGTSSIYVKPFIHTTAMEMVATRKFS